MANNMTKAALMLMPRPRGGKNFELGPTIFVSIDKSDAARSPVPPHYMAAL